MDFVQIKRFRFTNFAVGPPALARASGLLCLLCSLPYSAAGLPPIITVQPTNQAVPIGGTAAFVVVASSSTTLSYQWYFQSSPISGATQNIYNRTDAQPAHAGTYYVRVQNADGTVNSSNAVLTVLSASSVWDGGAANNKWSSPSSWADDTVPAKDGTVVIVMAGTVGLSSTVDQTWDIYGLSFSNNAGAFTLGGSQLTIRNAGIVNDSANNQTINNNIVLAASQTWSPQSGNLTVGGVVSGGGALTKAGPGTLILTDANTFTNSLAVAAGVLRIQNASALGSTASGTIVSSDAALEITGGLSVGNQVVTLSGSGIAGNGALRNVSGNNSWAGSITLAAASAIGADAGTLTLNGAVSGGFALTKVGEGTLALGAANTYSGGTTISNGTLLVNNASGSGTGTGAVTVQPSGLLAGNGSISGTVTNRGTLSAGNGVGTLATGPQNWVGGATNLWHLNQANGSAGANPGWDWLNISGALTISATPTNPVTLKITSLNLSSAPGLAANFTNTLSYVWTLATASGGFSGFDPNKFILDTSDFQNATGLGFFALTTNGNNLNLLFTHIADVQTTVIGPASALNDALCAYTLTVSNAGPDVAGNIVLSNLLPPAAGFVSASGGGSSNNGAVTWPAFNLSPGVSTNFTLTLAAPARGTMTNIVSSTATTQDPDASNNDGSSPSAQVVTTVTNPYDPAPDSISCVAATNVSTRTWSHTVGSGNSRILVVGIALADTSVTVNSVTYGGAPLTKITSIGTGNTAELWYLLAPPVGTANIVASWSTARDMTGWSGSFTNVDQYSPVRNSAVASGTSTTPTVTVAAAEGDLVVDTLSANGDAGSLSVGPGQTPLCSGTTGNTGSDCLGASSIEPGAASVTMSWATTASKNWGLAAAALRAVPTVQADVRVSVTGPASVTAGANAGYTLTVTNAGPQTATNIVLTHTLPAGAGFFSASGGGVSNNGAVTWPAFNLAVGGGATFSLTLTAPVRGIMTNTASSTAGTYDPDPANNDGSAAEATALTAVIPYDPAPADLS